MLDLPSKLVDSIQESVENQLKKPSLKSFIHSGLQQISQQQESHYLAFSFPFEKINPIALLDKIGSKEDFRYHWERQDLKLSFTGSGVIERLESNGTDRFKNISSRVHEIQEKTLTYEGIDHPLSGLNFLGGFSFFDEVHSNDWRKFGSGNFVIPEWIYIRSKKDNILTITLEISPNKDFEDVYNLLSDKLETITQKLIQSTSFKSPAAELSYKIEKRPDAYEHWETSVEKATQLITEGTFNKIVLARDIRVKTNRMISATRLLHHLREHYRTSYCFLIQNNNSSAFVGCSPERLASFHSNFVLAEGLAGSISRDEDKAKDEELAERLLNSSKDRQEHSFVVEAIEKRLKQFTDQIDYPEIPTIKKYINVQHLYTPITAWLNDKVDPLLVLERLHPTPAVGGTPRKEALPWIKVLENFERGWYAGPVGWFNSKGNGEFCVAIRSGLIYDNKARFYAGCGIVKNSVPQSEWEETNLKFIPMLSAIQYA